MPTRTHCLPERTLAARGETPAAFGRRCIPADCVAPSSHIPDTAPHRAQTARWGPRSAVVAPLRRGPHGADCAPWGGTSGRLAALGATPDFHHGLLGIRRWARIRCGHFGGAHPDAVNSRASSFRARCTWDLAVTCGTPRTVP